MPRTYLDYLDFELTIEPRSADGSYPVTLRSAVGEPEKPASMRLPEPTADEMSIWQTNPRHAAPVGKASPRPFVLAGREALRARGRALFEALIAGEIKERYAAARTKADEQKKGVRIRLNVRAPELVAVPWELLYEEGKGYLARSSRSPVTRYLRMAEPIPALDTKPPLRILGMTVSPRDLQRLDLGQEREHVVSALKQARADGRIEIEWMTEGTAAALQTRMRDGWHVLHFAGHGGFDPASGEGFVFVESKQGGTEKLWAEELKDRIKDNEDLRLVVLNCCDGARGSPQDGLSSLATALVRAGVPAVIAMQEAISDASAIELARVFYEGLAEGQAVDEALSEARKALAQEEGVNWALPVLYMRSPDGRILPKPAPPEPPPPKPPPLQSPENGSRVRWWRVVGTLLVVALGAVTALYMLWYMLLERRDEHEGQTTSSTTTGSASAAAHEQTTTSTGGQTTSTTAQTTSSTGGQTGTAPTPACSASVLSAAAQKLARVARPANAKDPRATFGLKVRKGVVTEVSGSASDLHAAGAGALRELHFDVGVTCDASGIVWAPPREDR